MAINNPYSDLGAVPVDPSNPYADLGAIPVSSQPSSVLGNVGNALEAAPGMLWNGLKTLGSDIGGSAVDFYNDPLQTTKNFAGGVGQGAANDLINIANLPANIQQKITGQYPKASLINYLTGSPLIPHLQANNANAPETQLGNLATNIIPFNLESKAAQLGLEPLLGSIAAPIAARTAVASANAGAQGQNPITGAAANLLTEGLAPAVGAISSPVKTATNYLVGKAIKDADQKTAMGSVLNTQVNTPEQAQNILNNLPEGFTTSLGELTKNPTAQTAENGLSYVPFTGINKLQASSVSDTDAAANDILGDMLGGTKPEDLNTEVQSRIMNNEQAARANMDADYTGLSNSLDSQGFSITQRPNLQATADKYLSGNSDEISKGINTLPANVSPVETQYIKNIAYPQDNSGVSFSQFKNLESGLKTNARNAAAQGDYSKQTMWNDLANGVRQDFDVNANASGIAPIKQQLETINKNAKSNYYDIYDTDAAQKVLGGNSNNLYNDITKRENQGLLNSLDPDTKNKLFAMGLKGNVKEDINNMPTVSSKALVDAVSNKEANKAELFQNLLSPDMQQRLKQLQMMAKLSGKARANLSIQQNGKVLAPLAKTAITLGSLFALHGLNPHTVPLLPAALVSGNLLARSLTNPNTLRAYANRRIPYTNKSGFSRGLQGLMRASVPAGIYGNS